MLAAAALLCVLSFLFGTNWLVEIDRMDAPRSPSAPAFTWNINETNKVVQK
jgi:heme/copper-type cytochrome/quinol oxidase subunit 1